MGTLDKEIKNKIKCRNTISLSLEANWKLIKKHIITYMLLNFF